MIWFIYKDYFKESIKPINYIKYIKYYVWLISIALLLLMMISLYFAFKHEELWLIFLPVIFATLLGLYFGSQQRKAMREIVGDFEEMYWSNLEVLKEILERRKLFTHDKIQLLVDQIDVELSKLKSSETLFKPLNSFTVVFMIPITILLFNKVLDIQPESLPTIILICLLLIMFWVIFYAVKPFLEEIIDYQYKRMNKIKQMFQDIIITDFSQ